MPSYKITKINSIKTTSELSTNDEIVIDSIDICKIFHTHANKTAEGFIIKDETLSKDIIIKDNKLLNSLDIERFGFGSDKLDDSNGDLYIEVKSKPLSTKMYELIKQNKIKLRFNYKKKDGTWGFPTTFKGRDFEGNFTDIKLANIFKKYLIEININDVEKTSNGVYFIHKFINFTDLMLNSTLLITSNLTVDTNFNVNGLTKLRINDLTSNIWNIWNALDLTHYSSNYWMYNTTPSDDLPVTARFYYSPTMLERNILCNGIPTHKANKIFNNKNLFNLPKFYYHFDDSSVGKIWEVTEADVNSFNSGHPNKGVLSTNPIPGIIFELAGTLFYSKLMQNNLLKDFLDDPLNSHKLTPSISLNKDHYSFLINEANSFNAKNILGKLNSKDNLKSAINLSLINIHSDDNTANYFNIICLFANEYARKTWSRYAYLTNNRDEATRGFMAYRYNNKRPLVADEKFKLNFVIMNDDYENITTKIFDTEFPIFDNYIQSKKIFSRHKLIGFNSSLKDNYIEVGNIISIKK